MKYIVMDERKDMTGDIFTAEFETKEDAIEEAERQWSYFTEKERQNRVLKVLESVNPDEEAENHFDGDVVWEVEKR